MSNFSFLHVTEPAVPVPPTGNYGSIAKVSVLSALLTLTLASNACSIAGITARSRKISRMYYFLLHLSVADALTALLTLLPELVWTLEEEKGFGGGNQVACKVAKYLQVLAPYLR